ncbi:MAG: FmdB family zinc ribbon protein, partial [Acidimicrobiales bacterium]
MPVYEYRCQCGQRYSELMPLAAGGAGPPAAWPCPSCGGPGRRVVSGFANPGGASPGPDRSRWPTTWEATNRGDRDTIRHWQKAIETRMRHEEHDPGLGTQPAAPVLS